METHRYMCKKIINDHPCEGCVHDGCLYKIDRPCDGCPNEERQKERYDE